MATLDVFRGDMFSTVALTTAVEKVPFKPSALGEMGIFEPDPIRNTTLSIESRQGKLVLIPFSERGQEGTQRTTEKRKGFFFDIPRLMHSDTITASELQNIRAFGTESELMQVEAEVIRRVAGPTGLTSSMEYTWEYHRLAAVQGLCLDADGSVKFNFFDEFGIAPAPEVDFALSAGTPNSIRPVCNAIVRSMARASQGAFTTSTKVKALCGDHFYDKFVNHPDVIRTYVNWADAVDIRSGSQGAAFGTFSFAGIDWINYRGSDDASTIAVPTDRVKFFPVGAPGVFKRANAPGESFEWVNTPGKELYLLPIFDRDRNAWWKVEAYSYPLFICVRPEVLRSAASPAPEHGSGLRRAGGRPLHDGVRGRGDLHRARHAARRRAGGHRRVRPGLPGAAADGRRPRAGAGAPRRRRQRQRPQAGAGRAAQPVRSCHPCRAGACMCRASGWTSWSRRSGRTARGTRCCCWRRADMALQDGCVSRADLRALAVQVLAGRRHAGGRPGL